MKALRIIVIGEITVLLIMCPLVLVLKWLNGITIVGYLIYVVAFVLDFAERMLNDNDSVPCHKPELIERISENTIRVKKGETVCKS